MITAIASQIVLNVLATCLKNKRVFTAFDVTTDARDSTDERIGHEDVRGIVHNEFLTGEFPDEYNREEFLELTNGHTAICYYPDGKAAEDHPQADNQSSGCTQQPATTTSPASTVIQSTAPKTKQGGSVKDGTGFICTETSKGVINIPDEIVKAVTPNAGTYDIQVDGGGIIYKVADGSGRLRIASSKLGSGGKFRLEVVTNTIIVEQV